MGRWLIVLDAMAKSFRSVILLYHQHNNPIVHVFLRLASDKRYGNTHARRSPRTAKGTRRSALGKRSRDGRTQQADRRQPLAQVRARESSSRRVPCSPQARGESILLVKVFGRKETSKPADNTSTKTGESV